ncbi:hypothetical protein PanWU01x14_268700, partial [Parasponia andersonii]
MDDNLAPMMQTNIDNGRLAITQSRHTTGIQPITMGCCELSDHRNSQTRSNYTEYSD